MASFFLYLLILLSPLLFIHLFHCGKCGKICGKLATFAHKCLISRRKILINTPKSCQNTLLDILFLAFLICCIPYILGTHGSQPLLCPKRLRLFSSSPHFVRVAVVLFFFYRAFGSQKKKPTSSCSHFGKGFRRWGRTIDWNWN